MVQILNEDRVFDSAGSHAIVVQICFKEKYTGNKIIFSRTWFEFTDHIPIHHNDWSVKSVPSAKVDKSIVQ